MTRSNADRNVGNDRSGGTARPRASRRRRTAPQRVRSRERLLFEAFAGEGRDRVSRADIRGALERVGLRLDDPRLRETARALASASDPIDLDTFSGIVQSSALLIERAVKGELIIPEFDRFADVIRGIHRRTMQENAGAVADYIPQLGRVDPEQYGVGLCTVDGQRLSLAEADVRFSLQSSMKPVNYALALEEHGEATVHAHIGCEPSGRSFNELALNGSGRPHNPMINAGAIMSTALIRSDLDTADRFDHVLTFWERLSGGIRPGFSNTVYLSERRTADRNFALGYHMQENDAFPKNTDLLETLEFYFQCCSLELDADAMSVVAATLANGGVCPLTGERVLRPETVQKVLSLMYSCGMYDYSGEWAFRIGLPAKSGVSGVVMVVVPNVMGLCVWSPRLEGNGNSVRGIAFCRELVTTYNFHNYDNLVGGLHGKSDPRLGRDEGRRNLLVDLCWAASEGDLNGIRRLLVQGARLDDADYDGRTALHLAASEGRTEVVSYILRRGAHSSPVDRWGNTPLDDARRAGHEAAAGLLEAHPTRAQVAS